MGLDTKTYWMTDRQSQCDFDSDFDKDQLPSAVSQSRERERERVLRQSVESCCSCGGGQFGNPEEGERSLLEAATKQRSEDHDWEH
jgi:hypothetical protein